MKRMLLFLLFIGLTLFLYSEDERSYPQSLLGPWNNLYEGSNQEQIFLTELQNYLQEKNISYIRRGYMEEELLHSFGESMEIYREGVSDRQFILILPVNSENFNTIEKTSFLLDLINSLFTIQSNSSLRIFLFTGEKNPQPVGTTVFLDQMQLRPERTGILYLDLTGSLSDLSVEGGTNNVVSSLWFIQELLNQLEKQKLRFRFDSIKLQIQRSGLSPSTPLITPYLEQGISTLLIQSEGPQDSDSVENSAPLVQAITGIYNHFDQLEMSLSDRNYYIFFLKDRIIYINESTFLLIFLATFSVILLIILFQFRNVMVNLKKYRNQSWMMPLFLLLLLTILILSTLLMEELGYQLNDSLIWMDIPLPAFLFKVTLTFIFSIFFLLILRGMPIPRSPHFYSYNAYFFAFLNLIAMSMMEITLSYFWIWTLFFTILFTQSRKLFLKLFSLLLIPIPFLLSVFSIMSGNYPELQYYFITSRLAGNFFLAVNLLPFTLLLSSLHYYRYYYKKERNSPVGTITLVLSFTLGLSLLVFFIARKNQIYEENRSITLSQEISIDEQHRTLILNSDREIGDIQINWNGKYLYLNRLGTSAEIEQAPPVDWMEIEQSENIFLDRRYIRLQLDPRGIPDYCYITLKSSSSFTIYDCTYPFEMNAQGTRANLLIGKYPPSPLPLEITINRSAHPELEIVFQYSRWPDLLTLEGANWEWGSLIFRQTISY